MEQTQIKGKFTTQDITLIPLFSALICIGAFIKIPIGLVPVSLQTVFVILAGFLLGAKGGFVAVGIYLILGLIGLPIFTAGGGPGYLFNPTFGYLLGMLIASPLVGAVVERFGRKQLWLNFLAAMMGLIAIYTMGYFYLVFIKNIYMGANLPLAPLFKSAVLVFLPMDTFWCFVAALVTKRLAGVIAKG